MANVQWIVLALPIKLPKPGPGQLPSREVLEAASVLGRVRAASLPEAYNLAGRRYPGYVLVVESVQSYASSRYRRSDAA